MKFIRNWYKNYPPGGVTNRRGLVTLVVVIVVLCVFVEPIPVMPVLA